MAVVEAVNVLESQKKTVQAEGVEQKAQDESRRSANVALVEYQNSYTALRQDAYWLR